MPEYLAPGVYVEEVSRGPTPIQGVPTSIAAIVGVTPQGPTAPTLVTSFGDYRARFGAADTGYMACAVAGFFANGGSQAVIVRIAPAGGGAPVMADFEGDAGAETPSKGLAALTRPEWAHISLVYSPDAHAVPGLEDALINHCEQARYRFAVLDAPSGETTPRTPADTNYAACYFPWIEAPDPDSGALRLVPPGGHVLGLYARNDLERGVFKAPANEVLRGVVRLAVELNTRQQEAFDDARVNVVRTFPGRGTRVWGARTLSTDPEWKYLSVRRLFIYLERSIELGTQWAVFEPNDQALWTRFRDTVQTFLRTQWRDGALLGATEAEAFFVRCDRSTMTQADLDSGRLVCLIGIAPVRPAEFVIFRVGQWTADRIA